MNPARIGGYEILGELGRGAMGVVYHARDAAIGREVAIKVIRIDAGTSDEESSILRQRLIREASVAGRIYHPGIVTVHQLGEEGNKVFVVMEFVEGSSLEHLLMHNPTLDRAWSLDILAQVAVALDYAHKAGVVHRDVKPANILVRSDGRVKIADFGIAKMTAGATSGMTAAGVSIGSPAYMSPEQIQAAEVNGRSDQFALATIAFQMLAGRMPFKGTTAHTLMFQIVTADPFDVQPGDTALKPGVRSVLARGLAKKAADRYPDCASFIQELTLAAGGAVPAPQTTTTTTSDPAKPKESKGWLFPPIMGALLTLGLVGGGIYYYLRVPCCAPPPGQTAETIAETTPVPTVAPTPPPEPSPTPTPSQSPIPTTAPTPTPVKASGESKTVGGKKRTTGPAVEPAATMTLLRAVTLGKTDVVKSLLAKGANINETDAEGSTPLMIAAEGTASLPNNLPLIQVLIDARASLEARDSRGRTALHRAAAEGRTNVVGLLLDSGAIANKKTKDGATPLYYAVQYGKMPVLELLIARHVQLDLADATETTPLMLASVGNGNLPNNLPMVEALLTAGAKVDKVDSKGRTALHRASAEPKPEVVRALLEHHAKPNIKATDGSTALMQAVKSSRPAVAQALLSHGVEVDLADTNGVTPLMAAAEGTKEPGQLVKLLLDHGAKKGLKDSQGRTAYQHAAEAKNTAAMGLLK